MQYSFQSKKDSKLPDNQEHEKEVAAKQVFVQATLECPNPWFSGKKKQKHFQLSWKWKGKKKSETILKWFSAPNDFRVEE